MGYFSPLKPKEHKDRLQALEGKSRQLKGKTRRETRAMLDSALTHFQSLGESAEGKDLMNLALLRGRVKKRQAEKNPSGSLRSFWQRIKDFFLRLRTPGKKEIQEATSSHIEDALTRKARTNLLERVCETVVDDIAKNTGKLDEKGRIEAEERIDTALLLLADHVNAHSSRDPFQGVTEVKDALEHVLQSKYTNTSATEFDTAIPKICDRLRALAKEEGTTQTESLVLQQMAGLLQSITQNPNHTVPTEVDTKKTLASLVITCPETLVETKEIELTILDAQDSPSIDQQVGAIAQLLKTTDGKTDSPVLKVLVYQLASDIEGMNLADLCRRAKELHAAMAKHQASYPQLLSFLQNGIKGIRFAEAEQDKMSQAVKQLAALCELRVMNAPPFKPESSASDLQRQVLLGLRLLERASDESGFEREAIWQGMTNELREEVFKADHDNYDQIHEFRTHFLWKAYEAYCDAPDKTQADKEKLLADCAKLLNSEEIDKVTDRYYWMLLMIHADLSCGVRDSARSLSTDAVAASAEEQRKRIRKYQKEHPKWVEALNKRRPKHITNSSDLIPSSDSLFHGQIRAKEAWHIGQILRQPLKKGSKNTLRVKLLYLSYLQTPGKNELVSKNALDYLQKNSDTLSPTQIGALLDLILTAAEKGAAGNSNAPLDTSSDQLVDLMKNYAEVNDTLNGSLSQLTQFWKERQFQPEGPFIKDLQKFTHEKLVSEDLIGLNVNPGVSLLHHLAYLAKREQTSQSEKSKLWDFVRQLSQNVPSVESWCTWQARKNVNVQVVFQEAFDTDVTAAPQNTNVDTLSGYLSDELKNSAYPYSLDDGVQMDIGIKDLPPPTLLRKVYHTLIYTENAGWKDAQIQECLRKLEEDHGAWALPNIDLALMLLPEVTSNQVIANARKKWIKASADIKQAEGWNRLEIVTDHSLYGSLIREIARGRVEMAQLSLSEVKQMDVPKNTLIDAARGMLGELRIVDGPDGQTRWQAQPKDGASQQEFKSGEKFAKECYEALRQQGIPESICEAVLLTANQANIAPLSSRLMWEAKLLGTPQIDEAEGMGSHSYKFDFEPLVFQNTAAKIPTRVYKENDTVVFEVRTSWTVRMKDGIPRPATCIAKEIFKPGPPLTSTASTKLTLDPFDPKKMVEAFYHPTWGVEGADPEPLRREILDDLDQKSKSGLLSNEYVNSAMEALDQLAYANPEELQKWTQGFKCPDDLNELGQTTLLKDLAIFVQSSQLRAPLEENTEVNHQVLEQRKAFAAKLLPLLKDLSTGDDHEALFFHVFELYFALGIDNPPAELPKDRDALMNKLDEFLRSADGQSTKTRLDAIAKRFKEGECGADVKQNKDAFENRIERFAHSLQVDGTWQTGPLKLGRGFGLFGWHAAKTTPNSAARWTGFAAQQVSKQMLSDSNYSAEGWDEMASVLSVKAQIVSVMQDTDEPEKKDSELLKDLFGTPIGIFTHSAMELHLLRFGQPCDDAGRTLRGYQKLLSTPLSTEEKQLLLTTMFDQCPNDVELWKRICGFRNAMHLIQEALKDTHPGLLPEAKGWLTALHTVASKRLGDQKTIEIDEDLYTMTQRLRGEERIGQQRIQVKKDPLIELNMFPEVQRDAMRQTLNVMKIEDSKNTPIDNPIPKEWTNSPEFGLPAIQKFWTMLEKHKISRQAAEQLLWLTNQAAEGNSYELLNLWVAAEAGYSQFHLDESQATALAKWIITPVSPQSTGETKALKLNIDQEGQSLTYTCTQFYEARRQDDPYRPPLRLQSTSTTKIENNGTTSGKMTLQRF